MSGLREAMTTAWHHGVFARAMLVALVVGSLLNLINQGDRLLAGEAIDGLKAVLTFLVPFAVSTHGALSVRRS